MTLILTGSQTVGPFFRKGLERREWSDLTADGPAGQKIRIAGDLIDGNGEAVPDGLIEIWQANAAGKYAHSADTRAIAADPHFRGFGRSCTDAEGRFSFITVLPGAVNAANGATQAPHINVSVFSRGLLKRLVTRIYFSDRGAANAADPLLQSIGDERIRGTMIAKRLDDVAAVPTYHFKIILQGDGETAFLDL
jgi:protocatechuate 3,4-dioxygenase, alpha subunit